MARKMIKSGQLRNKITFQVNTDSRDAFGGVVNSWATLFIAFASINPTSGSERLNSDKITADRSFEIVSRVNPSVSVSPQHRISWGSRLFDIESVSNFEEKGRFIKIDAIEREV
jgi:SPP1 family predicted phage head-tail adaptor